MNRAPRRSRRTKLVLALVWALTGVLVYFGWREFWFTCDDAFINYRYVSNTMLGRGLIWNPAPFQPVEGYTSFLWIVLLGFVWRITGVEPPDAACTISLLFGYATLLLAWKLLLRLRLPASCERYRLAFAAVALLAVATNPLFLTWLSSGFETSLFNFLLTWWAYNALAPRESQGNAWLGCTTFSATLAALTRPEGLLVFGATGLLLLPRVPRDSSDTIGRRGLRRWIFAFPILGVPTHLLWRYGYYGEWLPNTYYAKHTAWWPESGWRYAYCFLIEHGGWMWCALALAWFLVRALPRADLLGAVRDHRGLFLLILVLGVHSFFYTFAIGGDMFGYRVFSQLVLFASISFIWLASRLIPRAGPALALLILYVLVSHPMAWLISSVREDLNRRFPAFVRPLIARYEESRAWLINHNVCIPSQDLLRFVDQMQEAMPTRQEGMRVSWEGRPVCAGTAVGVLGWSLPNVAIIDVFGLNDWVVARHPAPTPEQKRDALAQAWRGLFHAADANGDGGLDEIELTSFLPGIQPDIRDDAAAAKARAAVCIQTWDVDGDASIRIDEILPRDRIAALTAVRSMGHERAPPPGYVEGFRPNVLVLGKRAVVNPRVEPLLDQHIIEWERRYRRELR